MNAVAAPPLVERLATQPASQWVDRSTLDAFRAGPGDAALLLWSDPVRFPECLDVAVVLPELRRHVSADGAARFRIGVVTAESEDAVARVFGATRRPAIVFLRDGAYVATVSGMHDWDDFVRAIDEALHAAPSRAPSIGVPLVDARVDTSATPGCH